MKGETTINEICQRYEVAPAQVHAWKKQLLEQGSELFGKVAKTTSTAAETERERSALYEKIGQLTVERDFLKKIWNKFQGNSGGN
jgi:transposase